MTELYKLSQKLDEFKKWAFQEFEDIKSEIRELRTEIGEILEQLC